MLEMIHVTRNPISPELVVKEAGTPGSGCVVTYIGLIRNQSRGRLVLSVEYEDADGKAADKLREIVKEIQRRWAVESVVIYHRVGKLQVGDINLVVAIAAAHRTEGFGASQYAIDRFKEQLPTSKQETYLDGGTWTGD